jgi:hypothetical protein
MIRRMDRLRRGWRVIAPYAIPAGVFAAVILLMFWRLWTPIEGEQRAFPWDAQWEYWGDLQLQADAVASGQLPLWNPHDRLGYPFYTDPQAGTLYPLQWPLIAAGAIGGTPWWLIAIKVLIHFELCALGMYALLRRRGLSPAPCYLGALIVLTSYPLLHNMFSALNWSFAWVPWWLLAAEAWIDKPTWSRTLAMAVTAALCALAGGWAAFWYGALVVGPFALVAVIAAIRALPVDERRAYMIRLARTGGAAIGWFIVLAGAQILATRGIVSDTVRDDRNVKFFGTTVFGPHDFWGMIVPRGQGENVYLGWGPVLWAAIFVALRPTARNLALAGVFVLGVLCAFGDNGPLPAFASVMPAFGLFRRAHRYFYVCVIPIGVLAAHGLALLPTLDDAARSRLRTAVIAATGLLVLVCGVGFAVKVAHPWKPDPVRDAFGWGLGAALAGGFATWLVLSYPKMRAAVVIAVVVASFDLWVARNDKIEGGMSPIPTTPLDGEVTKRVAGPPVPRRIYDDAKLRFRPGIRLGIRDLGGYETDPLALQRYVPVLEAVKRSAKNAARVGIAYLFLADKPQMIGPDVKPLDKPGMGEVVNAIPDVLWFDAVQIAPTAKKALDAMLAAEPGTIAVVEAGGAGRELAARLQRVDAPGAPPVAGRLTALDLNHLRAEIDAPADGIVVLTEMYHRGWTARVDGAEVPIVPVNGWARGVPVGPGHHVIELEFGATRFVVGAVIALLGWLATLAFVIIVWRRRRTA